MLRSCPGKTEALLLDPMDLLGRFSLSYEAILQGMAAEKGAQPFEAEREAAERASPTGTANAVPASQMDAWRRYLRALYFAALGAGMVEFRTKGSGWRRNMPTPKQLDNVRHALAGLLRDSRVPVEHRRLLTLIGQNASAMLRGDVSDLMSVGFALRDARRAGRDGWALLCAATIEEDK